MKHFFLIGENFLLNSETLFCSKVSSSSLSLIKLNHDSKVNASHFRKFFAKNLKFLRTGLI